MSNPELYFNSLLQLYFETIEKAHKGELRFIVYIIKELYDQMKVYLYRIKNNENLSQTEILAMFIEYQKTNPGLTLKDFVAMVEDGKISLGKGNN